MYSNLKIQNFGQIQEAFIPNLEEMGLVCIQGVNRDDSSATSNGAGKSTIPDAISWLSYGKTARGDDGDEVVNDTIGKNCMVQGERLVDGILYRVTRYRRHKIGKNTLTLELYNDTTSVWENVTKGTNALTQAAVESLIGAPYDVFVAGVYSGQEAMPDLPTMTDKALKEIVERASGTDRLQAAHDRAKEILRDRKAEVTSLTRTLTANRMAVVTAQANLDGATEQEANWHASRSANRQKLLDEIAKHIAAEDAINLAIEKAPSVEAVDKMRQALKAKQDRVVAIGLQNVNALADIKVSRNQLDGANAELKTALRIVEAAQKELVEINNKIGKPCDHCGKPVTSDDLDHVKSVTQARIDEGSAQVLTATAAADKFLAEHEILIQKAQVLQDELNALNSHMPAWEFKVKSVEEANESLRAEKAGIESKIAEARGDLEAFDSALCPFSALADARKKDLQAAFDSVSEAEVELEAADHNMLTAQRAVEVFGPSGVRAHLLDQVVPFLNQRTAHYLATLSDGNIHAEWSTVGTNKSGEIVEQFNISVTNDKGGKRFSSQSGGEKRKVRLATAMALQDLIASRASRPIRIWVADEIDDAIDEAGLERLMTLLEEKARERGTVLIISHNSLTDWVDNVITVTKSGGKSEVEWMT